MADTVRTRTAVLALLADNSTRAISPQDLRDAIVSVAGVYGMISTQDGSTAQDNVADTFEKLTNWTHDGLAVGLTPAFGSGSITVDTGADGIYLAAFQVSFSGAAVAIYSFHLHKNTSDTLLGAHRKTGTVDVGSASGFGLLSLAAGDEVSVYVQTDNGGGVSLTVADAQLALLRVA